MNILFIILSFLGIASLIAMMVIWILSVYHAATSQTAEMKQNRPLWILLIVFLGLIGSIVYYFVDGQKKWAIAAILSIVVLIGSMSAFAISVFVMSM